MTFEMYTRVGRSNTPSISIWPRGLIGFSMGVIKEFGLEKYNYVTLFYNRADDMIGFRFNTEHEVGSLKFTVRKNGAAISAKPFLLRYGIDLSQSRKFTLSYSEEESLYIASVNTPISEERPARKPRKKAQPAMAEQPSI